MWVVIWLGGTAVVTLLLWLLLRVAFVTPDDMSNAPFEKLKFSKKLCDFAMNFSCFVICGVHVVSIVLMALVFIPSIFRGDAYDFVSSIVFVPCGIAAIIFSVLAKTDVKGFKIAGILTLVETVSMIVLGEQGDDNMFYVFVICAALLVILNYTRIYNGHLQQVKGYPFYNNHEERIAKAAHDDSRLTAKEEYYRSLVDAESLLNGEKKSEEELKPKPPEVSVSADVTDIEEYFKQVDRQRQEMKNSGGTDTNDWLSG